MLSYTILQILCRRGALLMVADGGPEPSLALPHARPVLVPRKFEMLRKVFDGRRTLHWNSRSHSLE